MMPMPHGFKSERPPFPTRDASPSPQMGFHFSLPRSYPHSLPVRSLLHTQVPSPNFLPTHLPLHCLVCCEWPGPAKCPSSGSKDPKPDCLLRLPGCAYQNKESVVQSHPRILDIVLWTPGRSVGRDSPKPGHELMVSLEFSKKMKGTLLPIRAEALDSTEKWIQINPCSTIHWL